MAINIANVCWNAFAKPVESKEIPGARLLRMAWIQSLYVPKSWCVMLVFLSLACTSTRSAAISVAGGIRDASLTISYCDLHSDPTHSLIVAAWNDGTVVWSEDPLRGGPPYWEASIPPIRIEQTMTLVRSRAAMLSGRRLYTPEHAPFIRIDIWTGGERLHLWSWHELVEAKGDRIVTGNGLSVVPASRPSTLVSTSGAEFRLFRLAWMDIREALANVHPSTGRTVVLPEDWDEFMIPKEPIPVEVPI